MAGIEIAANQEIYAILEGVPLAEFAIISNTNSRRLTYEERRVRAVQKNKIFSVNHLWILWEVYPAICDELALKINEAKLMRFITAEPKKFHPYLVAEFYHRAVIAADGKSFSTEVYDTQLTISPQILAEELDLSNSGVNISTYKEGKIDIERKYWHKWKFPKDKSEFKLATKKSSLGFLAGMMLDILLKIVIQDVGLRA